MKNKIFRVQLVLLAVFTALFIVHGLGTSGDLHSRVLQRNVFPPLRRLTTLFTDLKFKLRGRQPVHPKIVVVEIDSHSLEEKGRWPWPRETMADLIARIYAAGAKVVGLDIVFSEANHRVPPELARTLEKKGLGSLVKDFDTDWRITDVIRANSDRLVMSWITESNCQPLYSEPDECPVTNPEAIASQPPGYGKFALSQISLKREWDGQLTPLESTPKIVPNLEEYTQVARHAGFANSFRDADGVVRRTSLVMMMNGRAYPSLPLEMARVAMKDSLKLTLDARERVESLEWVKARSAIPVTPSGVMQVNFRGPEFAYTYVSAVDVFSDDFQLKDELNRKLAGVSKRDVFKDAVVLVGLSALGVSDVAATPFTSEIPGVEVHATILDNLLSADPLLATSGLGGFWIVFGLMTAGALLLCRAALRFSGFPSLFLFLGSLVVVGLVDYFAFFHFNRNLDTSFLYLETASLFVFTVAAKYIFEERDKKFLRNAFNKYVSPAVVDSIVKDPSKLSLGGEKRNLSILFSDIRDFTTLSEKLDAKVLSEFLNEYFDKMTEIVFTHGGTLDKYIGDALMAFWGAPLSDASHAEKSTKAALEMVATLDRERAHWKQKFGIDVHIGIGVNSGTVSVGNMGSRRSFGYTVIGDDVNLASRLEGLTKYYGVRTLTTRATIELIGNLPAHRLVDTVSVKGKTAATEIFEVSPKAYAPELLRDFARGREAYLNRDFQRAIEFFEKWAETDGPSATLLARSRNYLVTAPEADWDGRWSLTSK